MKTGVSTACLYPKPTEKALESLLAAGFTTFEVFLNSDSELESRFLDGLRNQSESFGAQIYSVHFFSVAFEPLYFFSDYPRRFDDGLDRYRRSFAAAARTGARVAVFHGAHHNVPMTTEDYCERFYRISRAAENEGMILAQENVCRCFSATAESIRSIRSCLGPGRVKFVLDVKQAIRAGENPAAMAEAMGSDVVNLHLSDHTPEHDCLLPGEGAMNYRPLFDTLRSNGYQGPAIIEVYRSDFKDEEQVAQANQFLRKYLANLT